jgi:hypothetical protein
VTFEVTRGGDSKLLIGGWLGGLMCKCTDDREVYSYEDHGVPFLPFSRRQNRVGLKKIVRMPLSLR